MVKQNMTGLKNISKISPNHILLYSLISALCSHYQRGFLQQQTGTAVETHSQILSKERN